MKRTIIAVIITVILVSLFKGLLGLYKTNYLFFEYNIIDPKASLFLFLNWILNIVTFVGVFYIVRFIQMRYDVIYKERVKLRFKKISPYIMYSLLFIILILSALSIFFYV